MKNIFFRATTIIGTKRRFFNRETEIEDSVEINSHNERQLIKRQIGINGI